MGAHPRDTGSNPVEGNGYFFPPTVSSIFRLSLTNTPPPPHTHRSLQMLDVAVPQIGVGVFDT